MAPKLKQRSLSYHGIPIPPWRDRKLGAGTITIRFVIQGYVPSKKNQQQAISRRKEAVAFIKAIPGDTITKAQAFEALGLVTAKMRGNARYKKFVIDQKPAMELQRNYWLEKLQGKGLVFPISKSVVNIRYYFAQRYRQDTLNKEQSVLDLLKDCHIIADDDYTSTNPRTGDGDCFADEIKQNLIVVSLTFKLSSNNKKGPSTDLGDAQRTEN